MVKRRQNALPVATSVPSWLQSVRRVPWLSMAGAVLLFGAWLLDSMFASERASSLHELDLAQSRVSTNEVLMNHWNAVLLQERLKPEPDRLVIGSAGLAYLLFASNVMVTAASAVEPSNLALEGQAQNRKALYENAKNRFEKGDMDGVASLALSLERLERSSAPDLTLAFDQKYRALRNQERSYRQGFWLFYVAGSSLLACGYLVKLRNESAAV